MTTRERFKTLAALVVGCGFGVGLTAATAPSQRAVFGQAVPATPDLATLAAQVAAIQAKLPDGSHAMRDASYHFTNLWFAAEHQNWELAGFYLAETRAHLRWAMRVMPVHRDRSGRDVDLAAILKSMEGTSLKQLEKSIADVDSLEFEKAYRASLESCYSCHKAADRAFLRPQIPIQSEAPILNFDPTANWPK